MNTRILLCILFFIPFSAWGLVIVLDPYKDINYDSIEGNVYTYGEEERPDASYDPYYDDQCHCDCSQYLIFGR